MSPLALSDLLNPAAHRPSTPPQSELVDVRGELDKIGLAATSGPILVSPQTQQGLLQALEQLQTNHRHSVLSPPVSQRTYGNAPVTPDRLLSAPILTPSPRPMQESYSPPISVQHDVFLNRKMTLKTLYTY